MATHWRKSPPELIELFDEIVPPDPRVERRKLFGYPCAFVGGQMFMGLFQDSVFLRLGEDERAAFLGLDGAGRFEPLPGRVMRGAALGRWIKKAFTYAASLPPKPARPARKRPAPR